MRIVWILSLLLLTACNTGGPGFRGITPVEKRVDGSRFLLRVNGPLVEAIRISPEAFPRFEDVASRANIAAHELTGCLPRWTRGDPSMMVIGLSCNGARAPAKPKRNARYSCDVYDSYASPARRVRALGLECYI